MDRSPKWIFLGVCLSLSGCSFWTADEEVPIATKTVVTAEASNASLGSLALTARVSRLDRSGVPPGGITFTFADTGAPVPDCVSLPVDASGAATCMIPIAIIGTRPVTASYDGSAGFIPSVAPDLFSLNVTSIGDGTVISIPYMIDCGYVCNTLYPKETPVMLVAISGAESAFTGWNGACTGTSSLCLLTMPASATSTTATFRPDLDGDGVFNDGPDQCLGTPLGSVVDATGCRHFNLVVTVSGMGGGTVSASTPASAPESTPMIHCTESCTTSLVESTEIMLTATANRTSIFMGWTGDCLVVTATTCTVRMNAAKTVAAAFVRAYTLGGSVSGLDGGAVTLQNNAEILQVFVDGPFVFTEQIPEGAAYNVTVLNAPRGKRCAVSNALGVATRHVTTLTVTCVPSSWFNVIVSGKEIGTSSIQSGDSEIHCPSDCLATYPSGTSITLTAYPAPGVVLTGWSGICAAAGTSTTCTTTMPSKATSTMAMFDRVASSTLTVLAMSDQKGCVFVPFTNSGAEDFPYLLKEIRCPEENSEAMPSNDLFDDLTRLFTSDPVPIALGMSLADLIDLAGGQRHLCAMRSDHTVWCWGENDHGELGNGATIASMMPVQVKGPEGVGFLTDVVYVVGGGADREGTGYTCALIANGALYCWGSYASGLFGNGSTTDRLVPALVSGIDDVVTMGLDGYHTCALISDGSVYCWGRRRLDGPAKSLSPAIASSH